MQFMRAKIRVNKVERFPAGGPDGVGSESVTFSAVARSDAYPADGTDENNTFALFTPQADVSMVICNPELLGQMVEGDEFYLDFTPVGD